MAVTLMLATRHANLQKARVAYNATTKSKLVLANTSASLTRRFAMRARFHHLV